jgi:hypothetical protein
VSGIKLQQPDLLKLNPDMQSTLSPMKLSFISKPTSIPA